MPEPAIRIVIADDHPPTRAGIRNALEDAGFDVVADVGTAKTAVDACKQHHPDLCLLDIQMPGGGIKAASEISAAFPETAVVMLTVSRSEDDLIDALRAGAVGYLPKDIDPDRLPDALIGAMHGEAAIPRKLVSKLVDRLADKGQHETDSTGHLARLTSRQWQVLELLSKDMTTAEIAERLVVSEVTIRTHVAAIIKRLKVPDREAAIALLKSQG